jgi:hypothetical protein
MRILIAVFVICFSGLAFATLPPPSEEAKAQASEKAAKAAWDDKVAAYKLCVAMDRTATDYRSSLKAAGKDSPALVATAPCIDPGPYPSQMPATTK